MVDAAIHLCSCLHVFIQLHVYNTRLDLHFIVFPAQLEIPFTLVGSSKVQSRMGALLDSLVKHLLEQKSSLVL